MVKAVKKVRLAGIGLLFLAVLMAGCVGRRGAAKGADSKGKPAFSVVVTIFPEYDWVMGIIGDNPAGAEITLLSDNGLDMHSYQPSADDIVKMLECDLLVCVGGKSDEWVEKVLRGSANKDMKVVRLLDALGNRAKREEMVEGMEEDADEAEGDAELDEHVWLSLKNARFFVNILSQAIQSIDPVNARRYEMNADGCIDRLEALDKRYESMVANAGSRTLIFADRFPFRYLVDDYGLSYYAAFPGCSAETEASFETIAFLARKADELSLPALMVIEGSDRKIAGAVGRNTHEGEKRILAMDSMQSVTMKDIRAGKTYLSAMERNLEALREALR